MLSRLPKRRKRPKMGVKAPTVFRCDGHLQWIRGHQCAVAGVLDPCSGRMEAAHARTGTDGGMGMKPSDWWTLPLCFHHHEIIQTPKGEAEFERRYGIDMKATARALWAKSPHRHKSESKP